MRLWRRQKQVISLFMVPMVIVRGRTLSEWVVNKHMRADGDTSVVALFSRKTSRPECNHQVRHCARLAVPAKQLRQDPDLFLCVGRRHCGIHRILNAPHLDRRVTAYILRQSFKLKDSPGAWIPPITRGCSGMTQLDRPRKMRRAGLSIQKNRHQRSSFPVLICNDKNSPMSH